MIVRTTSVTTSEISFVVYLSSHLTRCMSVADLYANGCVSQLIFVTQVQVQKVVDYTYILEGDFC